MNNISILFFTAVMMLAGFARAEVKETQALDLRANASFLFSMGTIGGACTGFFISTEGYFVTAAHCLDLGYQAGGLGNQAAPFEYSRDLDWKKFLTVERDIRVLLTNQKEPLR